MDFINELKLKQLIKQDLQCLKLLNKHTQYLYYKQYLI